MKARFPIDPGLTLRERRPPRAAPPRNYMAVVWRGLRLRDLPPSSIARRAVGQRYPALKGCDG